MSYIIVDILKTSVYISIPIILIALLKDKFLSKYTYRFKYIFCILITLRMVFISSIELYLPFEFLKKKNNYALEEIYYMSLESNNPINYIEIIFWIWIIGTIYVVAKNIYRQIVFYKKIQNINYKIIDNNIIKSLDEEKKFLNIKGNINISKVNGLSSPALIGILNNQIIIPNKDYDEQELKWVFRHELIHFKRKDNLLKLFLMIASAIHWFNPLVKILKTYFEDICELSCDEKVVKEFSVEEVKGYALVLVNALRYRNTLKATLFSSQFNTNEMKLIKCRVEGILNSKKRKNGVVVGTLISMIGVSSIFTFSLKTEMQTAYADDSLTKISIEPSERLLNDNNFEFNEDVLINDIISRLSNEEKEKVIITKSETGSTRILLGDNKILSIHKPSGENIR